VLVTQEGSTTVEDILREPVELIDQDLDEVAGGDPFGNLAVAAVAQAIANTGFQIGQVSGVNFGGVNTGTIFG